jgi:hypothetical protein
MNEIEIALQYAKRKKLDRLNKNKVYRRRTRSNFRSDSYSINSPVIEQSVIQNMFSIKLMSPEETSVLRSQTPSGSILIMNSNEKTAENEDDLCSIVGDIHFDDFSQQQEISNLSLHPYTSMSFFLFSKNLINFIRNANISKTHTEQLINLIQSGLPHPNTLPNTYSDLLNLLHGNTIYLFSLFD